MTEAEFPGSQRISLASRQLPISRRLSSKNLASERIIEDLLVCRPESGTGTLDVLRLARKGGVRRNLRFLA
jgi:hypothetical protein